MAVPKWAVHLNWGRKIQDVRAFQANFKGMSGLKTYRTMKGFPRVHSQDRKYADAVRIVLKY